MEPFPNCFSICDTARSRARDFSVRSSAIEIPFRRRLNHKVQSPGGLNAPSFLSASDCLAFSEKQFFADESVELVRAGRIPGKAAHAFAVAGFPGIQGLRRFKTFLGFAEPIHFQAQQAELVISFTELRIQLCGLF